MCGARAVADAGASVRSVQALTLADGHAFDVFLLQSADGEPLDDASKIKRLHTKLLAAARKKPDQSPNMKRRFGDRREIFNIDPHVRIDTEASDNAVVIEAEGLNRPGLLFALTSTLLSLDLSIESAHIATYGERAVDAFYLTESDGSRISGAKRYKEIEKRLMEVLSAGAAT